MIKDIQIVSGYAGDVKIKAVTDEGEVYIIEKKELVAFLLKAVSERGFTTKLEPRQVYKRLIFNP